jgi:hypothetical protein
MNVARCVSLALAAVFCTFAWLLLHSGEMVFRTIAYMIVSLGFIWFGDELASYRSGGPIDEPTPGIAVKIAGWILLLITPFFVYGLKAYLQAGFGSY